MLAVGRWLQHAVTRYGPEITGLVFDWRTRLCACQVRPVKGSHARPVQHREHVLTGGRDGRPTERPSGDPPSDAKKVCGYALPE